MMMLAVRLTFEPPAWGIVLPIIAGLLLLVEAVAMVLRTGRNHHWAGAIGLTAAALLGGPVLAIGGLFFGVATATTSSRLRGRAIVWLGCWGSVVAALVWLVWRWPDGGAILAIAAAAVLWSIRAYRQTTSPLPTRAKVLLLGLRIVIIALAAFWTLRPVLQYRHTEEMPGMLLIGLDDSASMARRDMPADYKAPQISKGQTPVSRSSAVRQALTDQRRALDDIADAGTRLQFFRFAGMGQFYPPYEDGGGYESPAPKPTGRLTAIGDCAQAAFDPQAAEGRDVRGVVLITDGCNNTSATVTPEKFADRMASRNVPVFTVGVGSEKVTAASRAINVRSTGAADTAAAFGKMSIKPVIEAIGLAGRTIEVTCRFGDTVLPPQTRKITAEKVRETFEFTHVPLDTGFHRLRVIAKVVDKAPKHLGGLPTAEKLVQITDREIRLLYVEGKFRYETKYIARAIGTAERFVLHRRILLQPLRSDDAPPLGEKLDDWLRYHAIIFGDVAATHFTAKQLECIKQVVSEYGKGFCMIGGDKSFGRGGWAGTPIADIMPVDMARSSGNISKDIKPRPTPAGKDAELMRIGKAGQGAAEAWACLDSMPGANLLVGVKPAAAVLAETADGKPLIVAQTFGKGRTLAVAFDTTWRWVLSPGKIDTGEMQKRFWRQVGLYLAAPKGNVWIHTDKTTYDLAGLATGRAAVIVTAGAEDAAGLPLPKAALRVKLTGPDGNSIPISLAGDKHIKRGTLGSLKEPGMYNLSAETTSGGKTLTAEHKFQLVQRDIESAEVLANFALLKRMAARGNGKFVPLRDLPELLGRLKFQTHPKTRDVVTTELLLGQWRWWLISLLIALLLAEWIIRKRKGLV